MTQQLRALACSAEDPGPVPRTHIIAYHHL